MLAEFSAESSVPVHAIDADPKVPDEHCVQTADPIAGTPAFACRMVVNNFYTLVHGDTAASAKQQAAAQYVLLAAHG